MSHDRRFGVPKHPLFVRLVRRGRLATRGDEGFTLIEALLATVLFIMIAASLATVLVSALSSHRVSRHRTLGQEAAMAQIESIRQLSYDNVGIVSGNPPGTLVASKSVDYGGVDLTINTQVAYVADPTPTSYATSANYKRVTVTVLRAADGKQLTREVTYIAPPARAPLGGIGNAIVNVQVVDFALNTPVEGAAVALATGPSAPRNDTTDVTGTVTFAALTPNPVSGSTAYYDISAAYSGYVTLADDVSPGAAAHVQLAPGQTLNTALRIYRPATIEVDIENADGSAFAGNALVTVSSSRGSETFTYSGGTLTVTSVDGEQVVPSLQYTVSALAVSSSLPADPVTNYVPDDYPNDLDTSFTLRFPAVGELQVSVTRGGLPVPGATVTADGGPYAMSVSGTTDAAGLVTFADLPAGSGYTVTATLGSQTASTTASVVAGATTPVALALPAFGSVLATVMWAGLPASAASVTLSGGPDAINVSGTSDASGQVTFVNVTPGSGYTVTATKSGQSASASATVTSGLAANVTLNLPTGTLTVNVKRSGVNQLSATVTLTGGPMGTTLTGTTDSSGNVTFANVPRGSGYTVKAWKCSVSNPRSGQNGSVTVGASTTVNISFSTNTCPLP